MYIAKGVPGWPDLSKFSTYSLHMETTQSVMKSFYLLVPVNQLVNLQIHNPN